MSHTCHADGCRKDVPPKMFACYGHWAMVPADYQRGLWRHYRSGQEIDKRPSARYVVAQTRCRYEIARGERREEARLRILGELRGFLRGAPGVGDVDTMTETDLLAASHAIIFGSRT